MGRPRRYEDGIADARRVALDQSTYEALSVQADQLAASAARLRDQPEAAAALLEATAMLRDAALRFVAQPAAVAAVDGIAALSA